MGSGQTQNYSIYAGHYALAEWRNGEGCAITEVPWQQYAVVHDPGTNQGYTIGDIAKGFLESIQDAQNSLKEADILQTKQELATDKIELILADITARDRLMYDNLTRLNYDILELDNLKHSLSMPERYLADKTKLDLHKLQMQAHDLIRREMKDAARDISFAQKELRESLLEAKLQNVKTAMLMDDEPQQSYQPWGGLYK